MLSDVDINARLPFKKKNFPVAPVKIKFIPW